MKEKREGVGGMVGLVDMKGGSCELWGEGRGGDEEMKGGFLGGGVIHGGEEVVGLLSWIWDTFGR